MSGLDGRDQRNGLEPLHTPQSASDVEKGAQRRAAALEIPKPRRAGGREPVRGGRRIALNREAPSRFSTPRYFGADRLPFHTAAGRPGDLTSL